MLPTAVARFVDASCASARRRPIDWIGSRVTVCQRSTLLPKAAAVRRVANPTAAGRASEMPRPTKVTGSPPGCATTKRYAATVQAVDPTPGVLTWTRKRRTHYRRHQTDPL